MPIARLLVDPPAPGDWNMAVDEALLQSAAALRQTTLRFYRWQAPTLSLGYFQEHAQREAHRASQACSVVRRATGGGAIVHDEELTYSFITPIGDRWSADVERLYYAFHETLIETLQGLGIVASLCKVVSKRAPQDEPFLCFQRRASGDVLVGEHKVCGSAQRRHHGAVLQHGSILLQRSQAAPELPGLAELSAQSLSPEPLILAWKPRLAARLELDLQADELSQAEHSQAMACLTEKFARPEWTLRR